VKVSDNGSIENPILPGFNPDPSIVRVGDDYFIATSTFEWYPGVQIHHSKDLINWRLVARPLNRSDLLNLYGVPDSCGVWAPCLSYHNGLFHLIYTDVKRYDGIKDPHNYLTTCSTIDGDWSEPIYLNSSGFDPSMFHDEDGRQWLVNMVWDHRPGQSQFGGIHLQEYSAEQCRLIGPVSNIFKGTEMGITEAPHLYKRGEYYYLVTAEGGTEYNHVMTMARSQSITGPYEVDPNGYVVTSKENPELKLQRAGHGDFVETQNGEIYIVHLCSRPITDRKRSPMGRETAIQEAYWTSDGWLRLKNGSNQPDSLVNSPILPAHPWPAKESLTKFTNGELPIDFQWLRTPDKDKLFSLRDRPGFLRLFGRESLGSRFYQALVARRQQAFRFTAITKVEFDPDSFLQLAGLVNYYNAHKYHYLFITRSEEGDRQLGIMSCEGDQSENFIFPLTEERFTQMTNSEGFVDIPNDGAIFLRCDVDYEELVYSWSINGQNWNTLPIKLDQSVLSDETGKGEGANFTGAFVGICCQDLAGTLIPADFEFFEYTET